MSKRVCRYNFAWEKKPEYKEWLQEDKKDDTKAVCRVCRKSFSIANMGEAAQKSHIKKSKIPGKLTKHEQNVKIVSQGKTISTFGSTSRSEFTPVSSSSSTSTPSTPSVSLSQSQLKLLSDDVCKAEVLWVLKNVFSHYSYHSSEEINLLFQEMFSDSDIAKSFKCGEKKTAYIASYGLAPFFKNQIITTLNNMSMPYFVHMFDESYVIRHTQNKWTAMCGFGIIFKNVLSLATWEHNLWDMVMLVSCWNTLLSHLKG